MSIIMKQSVTVLLLFAMITIPVSYSVAENIKKFNVTIGYGPQSLSSENRQNNSVIDFNYTFYRYQLKTYNNFSFLLGSGYSYLWTDVDVNKNIHLFSLLPSIRYILPKSEHTDFQPFIGVTIGPSVMSSTTLGYQEQGSRFIFNDFFSIGAKFGSNCEWEICLSWRHFSNGQLFSPNPGFDVPFCVSLEKLF